jgi:DNA-binding Lrp family transcriptional regulator
VLPSVADVDRERLSDEARETLEEIAWPMANDGRRADELAGELGITPREVSRRLQELGAEMKALAGILDLPAMSAEEFESLKASIAEHGQLVPVLVDARGELVDGFHRTRACTELGIEPVKTVVAGDADQLRSLALVVNVARRHLTAGARRGIVAGELRRDPSRSDRAIAAAVGVTHPTVAAVRAELEEREQLERLTSRTGLDGRTRRLAEKPNENVHTVLPSPFAGQETAAGAYRLVITSPNGAVVYDDRMAAEEILLGEWLDELVERL